MQPAMQSPHPIVTTTSNPGRSTDGATSYQQQPPIRSGDRGVTPAKYGSDARTRATACADEVTAPEADADGDGEGEAEGDGGGDGDGSADGEGDGAGENAGEGDTATPEVAVHAVMITRTSSIEAATRSTIAAGRAAAAAGSDGPGVASCGHGSAATPGWRR